MALSPYNDEDMPIYGSKGVETKMAQYITANEAISLTAKYTGYTQEVVKEILYGYAHIVSEVMKMGYGVKMPRIGRFCLTQRNEQAGRKFKQPSTGEVIDLPTRPAYKKPSFRFTPAFKQEIRELTEGDSG